MSMFAHGGISILLIMYYLDILKGQLEQRNHQYVNKVWISDVLGVKTRSPRFLDHPTALQFDSHSVQRTLQDDQRAII